MTNWKRRNGRLLIIRGCGKAKRDERSPARDLYISSYAKVSEDWAKSVDAEVLILSAKHGLIAGTDEIDPYSSSWSTAGFAFEEGTEPPIGDERLAQQLRGWNLSGIYLTLAGGIYIEKLSLAGAGVVSINPFKEIAQREFGDGRQGYQTRLMKEHKGEIPSKRSPSDPWEWVPAAELGLS